MPIFRTGGDILESPAQILTCPVNCVGVMGAGLALKFKRRFPRMYEDYFQMCLDGKLTIGTLWLWRASYKHILCFPTKKHWREKSKVEYIDLGLRCLVQNWRSLGRSIALPKLGCGLGGLDFTSQVWPVMQRRLNDIPIPIYVYL